MITLYTPFTRHTHRYQLQMGRLFKTFYLMMILISYVLLGCTDETSEPPLNDVTIEFATTVGDVPFQCGTALTIRGLIKQRSHLQI